MKVQVVSSLQKSDKMHILLLAPLAYKNNEITSGVPKVSAVLLRSLKEKYGVGIQLTTLSFHPDVAEVTIDETSDMGKVYYIPSPKNNLAFLYLPSILKLRKYIRKINPDIVHSQGFPELILAGMFSGYSHVTTLHGIIKKEYQTETNPKFYIRGMIRSVLERFYLLRLCNIISISDYISRHIKNRNITIRRIDNPIAREFFQLNKCVQAEELMIVQVGSLVHRKGAHILIEAIIKGQLTDLKVCFVGSMNDKQYLQSVQSTINKNPVYKNIFHFYDSVPDEALYQFYQKASIIILPSLEETSPLSLAQAMACGSFIMASDCEGIQKLITDKHNGVLFKKDSPDAIIACLRDYQEGKFDVEKTTLQAKMDAFNRFHPESVAEQTFNFYKEIIKIKSDK